MPDEIIPPTTGAIVTHAQCSVKTVPATISAGKLAGAETVHVFFTENGQDWVAMPDNGSAMVLTADEPIRAIFSPLRLGFLKDATPGNLVGVYLTDQGSV